ncbi:MAG: cutinase family protein [Candidatus Saccharimonadales bacterium]
MQGLSRKLLIPVLVMLLQSFWAISPAEAVSPAWPQDTSDLQSDYVMSTANGSVVAANCASSGSTAFKTFAPDGTISATVPQVTGKYTYVCWSQGAVAKDGTVFGYTDNRSGRYTVVAYRGTTLTWEISLRSYCSTYGLVDRALKSMTVGVDGYLYAVSVDNKCQTGNFLNKIDPSTGRILFEKNLGKATVTWFSAYQYGVILQNTLRTIRYIKHDGSDYMPTNLSQAGSGGWIRAANIDGRVFQEDFQSSSGTCVNRYKTINFQEYTPTTGRIFKFSWSSCWNIASTTATTNGGATVVAYNDAGQPVLLSYTPNDSSYTVRSSTLSTTEDYRTFTDLGSTSNSFLPAIVRADGNGNILLTRQYNWRSGSKILRGWQFTLQRPDLSRVAQFDTNWFDFQQTTRFARGASWALSQDKLYLSIGYCTNADTSSCQGRTQSLYAVPLQRLGLDYPRSATLGIGPTPVTCPTTQLVGVRGSGENPFEYEGVGRTIQDLKNQLVAGGLSGLQVAAVAYPAVPVDPYQRSYPADYSESVKAGVDALTGYLTQLHKDCPATDVILAGYSQGAHVAADVASALPTEIQAQIHGIVLFGDPRFNPQSTFNRGTYDTSLYGIWSSPAGPGGLPPRELPPSLTGKTASYCLANDPICNFTSWDGFEQCFLSDGSNCAHYQYASIWTKHAADWLLTVQ